VSESFINVLYYIWESGWLSYAYCLDDHGSILVSGKDGTFSLRHCVQTGTGAHTASYPEGTGALTSEVKLPGHESDH